MKPAAACFLPPLAQDRVSLRPDGRVLVELKTVWRDGTFHFLFEPVEFLEKPRALETSTIWARSRDRLFRGMFSEGGW